MSTRTGRRLDEAKVADTLRGRSVETVQVPVPVQAPSHPMNVLFADGLAVSVTVPPMGADATQVDGQAILEPLTVPGPITWTFSRLVSPRLVRLNENGPATRPLDAVAVTT